MKKKIYAITIVAILAFIAFPSTTKAQDFIDKGTPRQGITCGLRFGITSSNMKTDLKGYSNRTGNDWGTGFAVGGVVNLNVRNYLTIQPGFFFENRSYDYTAILHDAASQSLINNLGHTRNYTFSIPILASMRFQVSKAIEWNIDFGPYFNWGIGGDYEMETIATQVSSDVTGPNTYVNLYESHDYYGDEKWQHKKFDWGIKCGTGFRIMNHYVINFYYMLGLKDISSYKQWDMHSRGYTVSIGYDF